MEAVYSGRHVKKGGEVRYKKPNPSFGEFHNLQDEFLAAAINQEVDVDIFLRNESVRQGKLLAYDNWSVLLASSGKQYLLFKSAIMGIIPRNYVQMNIPEELNDYHLRVAESSYYH